MKWNRWVRQSHRWVSIAFTVGFVVNGIAASSESYPPWLGLFALLPLLFLLGSGLYLFALPYLAKSRATVESD